MTGRLGRDVLEELRRVGRPRRRVLLRLLQEQIRHVSLFLSRYVCVRESLICAYVFDWVEARRGMRAHIYRAASTVTYGASGHVPLLYAARLFRQSRALSGGGYLAFGYG